MTHLTRAAICFALVAGTATALAQVRLPGEPQGARHALAANVPVFEIPAPDVAQLRHEDLTPRVGPLRFGVPMPVFIDVIQDGAYEVTADDRIVFRVALAAPGAHSLGLEFSRYDLPEGGQLFIHEGEVRNVFGAYDRTHVIEPSGEFVIEPFPGDRVTIEYSQPVSATKLPNLVVSRVIYDYRNVFELMRGLNELDAGDGTEGGCALVDVNCPEGAPFPNQKRATMRTIFGGGLCSASLINNTQNNGTRYVYTANHCGQGSTTVFYFNYQTSGCGSGSAPQNQTVSGATFLASDVDTDGRLLRINNTIPTTYNPYYAGWSRSTSNLTFGMSMHHPSGGPKKISIDNNGGGQVNVNFQGIGTVKCWSIANNVGATLGGSSGGPLFDQNNRIRGALTGGPTSPCNQDYFGRFYSFWAETTIAQYLDPTASGVTAIDGFDPNSPPASPTITTVSPSTVSAFGPALVTLTGTNFINVTAVTVNGTPLPAPPTGYNVVNSTTITFVPPTPTALGTVNVTVTNSAGTSAAKTLTYVETQPLFLAGPVFLLNGQTGTWSWGGKANQIQFFNFATTNNTTTFNGQTFLLYLGSVPLGNTSAIGFGQLAAPISGVPSGITIYTQVMTIAPPGNNPATLQLSNITASQVLL